MEDKTILTCVGIGALTILEIIAMLKGIDGYLFGGVIAIISGLAGYKIKSLMAKE